MECLEASKALKSSFNVAELGMKLTNTQSFCDDFWCVSGLPGGGEDFSVDEFFDLPNEEEEEEEEEGEEKGSGSSVSLDSCRDRVDESCSFGFSPELAVPVDDMQELELWSHLMDDSIAEPALTCPNLSSSVQNKKTGFLPPVELGRKQRCPRVFFIPTAVPHKPRSKRPRTAINRSRFLIKTECLSTSSPSSPVSTLLFSPGPLHLFSIGKPAQKKQRKKPASDPTGPAVQRRCSHCQVTKTPQWRAGPGGPKTLCNACGVRFKSGRLFPEYRPACSPTFLSEVHSNSHRKVLEMRRQRETKEPV